MPYQSNKGFIMQKIAADGGWLVASPGDISDRQSTAIIGAATGRRFQVERYHPSTGVVEIVIDNGRDAPSQVIRVAPYGRLQIR
jgi:hypothetical protein